MKDRKVHPAGGGGGSHCWSRSSSPSEEDVKHALPSLEAFSMGDVSPGSVEDFSISKESSDSQSGGEESGAAKEEAGGRPAADTSAPDAAAAGEGQQQREQRGMRHHRGGGPAAQAAGQDLLPLGSFSACEGCMRGWQALEVGGGVGAAALARRVGLQDSSGRQLSFWHSIPLHAAGCGGAGATLLHAVCTTPAGGTARFQVAQEEEFTPLRPWARNGKPLHFAAPAPVTCGVLPQTWAASEHARAAAPGGGGLAAAYATCPMEVLDLGATGRAPALGAVYVVKALAAVALVRSAQLSWKVVGIAADDDMAGRLHDVADIQRELPGALDAVRVWLTSQQESDEGEGADELWANEDAAGLEVANTMIAHAHRAWQRLAKQQQQQQQQRPPAAAYASASASSAQSSSEEAAKARSHHAGQDRPSPTQLKPVHCGRGAAPKSQRTDPTTPDGSSPCAMNSAAAATSGRPEAAAHDGAKGSPGATPHPHRSLTLPDYYTPSTPSSPSSQPPQKHQLHLSPPPPHVVLSSGLSSSSPSRHGSPRVGTAAAPPPPPGCSNLAAPPLRSIPKGQPSPRALRGAEKLMWDGGHAAPPPPASQAGGAAAVLSAHAATCHRAALSCDSIPCGSGAGGGGGRLLSSSPERAAMSSPEWERGGGCRASPEWSQWLEEQSLTADEAQAGSGSGAASAGAGPGSDMWQPAGRGRPVEPSERAIQSRRRAVGTPPKGGGASTGQVFSPRPPQTGDPMGWVAVGDADISFDASAGGGSSVHSHLSPPGPRYRQAMELLLPKHCSTWDALDALSGDPKSLFSWEEKGAAGRVDEGEGGRRGARTPKRLERLPSSPARHVSLQGLAASPPPDPPMSDAWTPRRTQSAIVHSVPAAPGGADSPPAALAPRPARSLDPDAGEGGLHRRAASEERCAGAGKLLLEPVLPAGGPSKRQQPPKEPPSRSTRFHRRSFSSKGPQPPATGLPAAAEIAPGGGGGQISMIQAVRGSQGMGRYSLPEVDLRAQAMAADRVSRRRPLGGTSSQQHASDSADDSEDGARCRRGSLDSSLAGRKSLFDACLAERLFWEGKDDDADDVDGIVDI